MVRLLHLLACTIVLLGSGFWSEYVAGAEGVDLEGVHHVEWAKNATIYELNTRNYTPEGTLAAAERHLPRLRALGVDIVWLMPIFPIGKVNRSGALGSPYAVADFRAVNTDLGTLGDLRHFVHTAHSLGMHVILDWVPNHSAPDNPLVAQHPDWYQQDAHGRPRQSLWENWSDTVAFNYANPAMRQYMIGSMIYWLREADVDGFRCDTAGFVPMGFWDIARAQLDRVKPVFMLAEYDQRDVHMHAFDTSYATQWDDSMVAIAHGDLTVAALRGYYAVVQNSWPTGAIRLLYVTNHDKNTFEGTEYDRYGPAREGAIVLSVAAEGMPLLYSGQEAGLNRRLPSGDKDVITWREDPTGTLYRRLFALKHANHALWNAPWGGRVVDIGNSAPPQIFSFVREQAADRIFGVFNLSAKPEHVAFKGTAQLGRYSDFTTGEAVTIGTDTTFDLPPWGWKLMVAGNTGSLPRAPSAVSLDVGGPTKPRRAAWRAAGAIGLVGAAIAAGVGYARTTRKG